LPIFMGVLNKSAGVVAPMVFAALILGGMKDYSTEVPTPEDIEMLADNLVLPYVWMALMISLLALCVKFSPLPELVLEEENSQVRSEEGSVFRFPILVLVEIALYLYVGVDVIAGYT